MLKRTSNGGFTLLEVMLVVLLIALLTAIALPNWVRAKNSASTKTCLSNLRQIEQGKERYAMENSKPNGAPAAWSNIVPQFLKNKPECPSSGTYTVGSIGTDATCTIPGHKLN